MKLAIFGPPGGGKGTQAKIIAEKLGLKHISTGDILREEVREGTELGLEAKGYMERGELVPDELILRILKKALGEAPRGFILDGFPRTLKQAEELESITELDEIINIVVPDEEIIRRVTGRLVCPGCGATYHEINNPPKVQGRCDRCGTELIKRSDDREETVKKRLEAYHTQSEPVLEYYRRRGIVTDFDGVGGIEEISERILKHLRERYGKQ